MEQKLRTHLLDLGAAYCAETGYAMKTVAQKACGDFRFFDRVQNGASFTVKTYDRAVRFFWDNWPRGYEWPADIPGPETEPDPTSSDRIGTSPPPTVVPNLVSGEAQ